MEEDRMQVLGLARMQLPWVVMMVHQGVTLNFGMDLLGLKLLTILALEVDQLLEFIMMLYYHKALQQHCGMEQRGVQQLLQVVLLAIELDLEQLLQV